jgi:adenosylcobinamide-phosphate synthase
MFFYGKDWVNSFRWALKHVFKGPALNGDTAEAPMAGGLGIQLGGMNFYNSLAVHKPYLGDSRGPLAVKHIRQSVIVSYMVSGLMLAAGWMAGLRG